MLNFGGVIKIFNLLWQWLRMILTQRCVTAGVFFAENLCRADFWVRILPPTIFQEQGGRMIFWKKKGQFQNQYRYWRCKCGEISWFFVFWWKDRWRSENTPKKLLVLAGHIFNELWLVITAKTWQEISDNVDTQLPPIEIETHLSHDISQHEDTERFLTSNLPKILVGILYLIPDTQCMIYFTYTKTIQINHSWIGKYTNTMHTLSVWEYWQLLRVFVVENTWCLGRLFWHRRGDFWSFALSQFSIWLYIYIIRLYYRHVFIYIHLGSTMV